MRQAGRYLPEYRAIREKSDFLTLCKTPELATEVTIQPVDIIGVDAAILFSDILVIPEAMGMKLEIVESKGPTFDDPIRSIDDLNRLSTSGLIDRLKYVFDAIKLTKERLAGRVPLFGDLPVIGRLASFNRITATTPSASIRSTTLARFIARIVSSSGLPDKWPQTRLA